MSRLDFRALAAELAANAPTRAELERDSAQVEAALREQRIEDSGIEGAITAEDRTATSCDQLASTHALRTVSRWLTIRRTSPKPLTTLALVGETGRGKTVAGAWLISRLGGVYVTAEQACRGSLARFGRERDAFDRMVASRVLVVDDLGTERDPELGKGALWDIVNARVGLDRAWTLLTGNLSESEFRTRYGERTIRRIEHQGTIVTVHGGDLRRGRRGGTE